MTKELEEWGKPGPFDHRRPQLTTDDWGYYAGQQADHAKVGVRLLRDEFRVVYDKLSLLELEISLLRRENAELKQAREDNFHG